MGVPNGHFLHFMKDTLRRRVGEEAKGRGKVSGLCGQRSRFLLTLKAALTNIKQAVSQEKDNSLDFWILSKTSKSHAIRDPSSSHPFLSF